MNIYKGAALLLLISAAAAADPPAGNAEPILLAHNSTAMSRIDMISAREPTAAPGQVERTVRETLDSVNRRLSDKIDARYGVLVESMFPAS